MIRTIIAILTAFSLFACAAATDDRQIAPASIVPGEQQNAPGLEVPNHVLAGEQSPGDKAGQLPSWSKDPDACASPRFLRDGGTVTDSTTGLVWGAQEALTFTPASAKGFDATTGALFANGLCQAFGYSRAATKAEIDALAKAVAGCPLPGAFYSVDLWNVMSGDAGDSHCVDLKTDTDAVDNATQLTPATCTAIVAHTNETPANPIGYPTDISRAALCIK